MECVQVARRDETAGLGFKAPKGQAEDDDFWEKTYNKTVHNLANNGIGQARKDSNALSKLSEDRETLNGNSRVASRKQSTQPAAADEPWEGLEEYPTDEEELFSEFLEMVRALKKSKRISKK